MDKLTIVPAYEIQNWSIKKNSYTDGQENYWAAIFLVPGGARTIMNVKTKVTENITLYEKDKAEKISLNGLDVIWYL